MRLIASPSPKLILGWNHEFSVGLTVEPYILEHDFQRTAEFRNHKDHGLTEHKAHGTDFHMLGALSELHLSYAEWLQEVWNHCSSKRGDAEREQSIPAAWRSPRRHGQSRPSEIISLRSQHRVLPQELPLWPTGRRKMQPLLILQDPVWSPACFPQQNGEQFPSRLAGAGLSSHCAISRGSCKKQLPASQETFNIFFISLKVWSFVLAEECRCYSN